MKKFLIVILNLTFIPGFLYSQDIKPGIVITKKNYANYLKSMKELLPRGSFIWLSNGLKEGWTTIPVVEKKIYPPPKGFAEATAKNTGKFKVGKDNKLTGIKSWQAGLPFPNPKSGAELAWNVYRRRECAEEFECKSTFCLLNKDGKLERSFRNFFIKKAYVGRTDIFPIPEITGNNGNISWKEAMLVFEPFDVRGFSQIRIHYEDLYKDDDVYSYIPALRRIRRLTGTDVTDPVLGSDCCYDDFEGWHQKLNPRMTFKSLGYRNFLVPSYYTDKTPMSFAGGNCFQVNWEIRPLWMLEVLMNDPNYAYQKRIIYAEKEDNSYGIAYYDTYDLKSRLWRTYDVIIRYLDESSFQRNYVGFMYADQQAEHYSGGPWDPIVSELGKVFIPPKTFTVRELLKRAK
ncbi:MAG: DUF1329 domain-containing protein [Thermodesulfobacteriota bacterium]|nr:DUF1329 domain-containing protein [Thermodesulfobacteriota bacterium]